MHTNNPFHFENSYLSLPDKFYSLVQPAQFLETELLLLNEAFCSDINVSTASQEDLIRTILATSTHTISSFAQAYAGHQFGNFTMLGDGRAIVLGEHLTADNRRVDIQLKGGGKTPYSRRGDGRATVKAMLREYLMSEAMHHLNIPSSRSLAVLKTGETVYRDPIQEGAVLVRVMKSHIRVGTFEYAARFCDIEDVRALLMYSAERLYPGMVTNENLAIDFFNQVVNAQMDLVANWMRVGFIHGVMNTDNTAISGETFDYGPCAFMNNYHPDTVYSSIDSNGRYAFGNQPRIIFWNLTRLLETLLPLFHENKEKSIALDQAAVDGFSRLWYEKYYGMLLKKIGFATNDPQHHALVDELLALMKVQTMDYTNTFYNLTQTNLANDNPILHEAFQPWLAKWRAAINLSVGMDNAIVLMQKNNPILIPRNHQVEQALDEASHGNFDLFNRMLQFVSSPYQYQIGVEEWRKPSDTHFDNQYQTFCGT